MYTGCSSNKSTTNFTKVYVNYDIINEGIIGTKGGGKREMTNIISRCNICGEFFQSKKELKDHKDKNHRITNSMLVVKKVPIDHDRV